MMVAENFDYVLKAIRKAERRAGRAEGSAKLIAVTKSQDSGALSAALSCGQRLFGENKVQEARSHWSGYKADYPDIELHLIGPLQTNKVAQAVALFDCIQTLDREKLAVALSDEIKKQEKSLPCFIQVNTGEEAQKSGILPAHLKDFLRYCVHDCGLSVTGLMGLPPVGEPAALHFALLKKLSLAHDLPHLSMGMSADFIEAVSLGATYVRVGSALFGSRT